MDYTCRILVVDDCPSIAELIRAYTKAKQIEVVEASDAESALRLLRSQLFDVVFMDMYMPGMDGAQAVSLLRAWERDHGYPQTPVVAITDRQDQHAHSQMLASGCSWLLAKPLSRESFLAAAAQYDGRVAKTLAEA